MLLDPALMDALVAGVPVRSAYVELADLLVGAAFARTVSGPLVLRMSRGVGTYVGRPRWVRIDAANVVLPELEIEKLSVFAEGIRVVPGRSTQVRVRRCAVTATVGEGELNDYAARKHLPLRLAFRQGGVVASGHLGRRNIGSADVDLDLVDGKVRARPKHLSAGPLGVGLTPVVGLLLTTRITVPRMPHGTRLVGIRPETGKVKALVEGENMQIEVTREMRREFLRGR